MNGQNHSHTPLNGRIWVKDLDDWLGVTNSRERRKIQNRRNQRALRAKKQGGFQNTKPASVPNGLIRLPGSTEQLHEFQELEMTEATIQIINLVRILEPNWEGNRMLMQRFESFATHRYMAHIGAVSILPSLSQFNFVKALFTNMEVLGLSDDEMSDEALSPFNRLFGPPPHQAGRVAGLSKLPTALQPTDLQHATIHHPWIDLLPMPVMRENIFRREADSFDEETLCHAMRGQAPDHKPGLLVWSDPWDPTGWEVTEEFARSWGWVVADCTDLLHSTNTWRARRGEKALFPSLP